MINIAVEKNPNENNASLMRRFTRKVQSSSVLPSARSRRFYERPASETLRKKRALKSLRRRAEYRELYKLGKVNPSTRTRRR
jgi:ribosomal protein S21